MSHAQLTKTNNDSQALKPIQQSDIIHYNCPSTAGGCSQKLRSCVALKMTYHFQQHPQTA